MFRGYGGQDGRVVFEWMDSHAHVNYTLTKSKPLKKFYMNIP